MNVQMRRAMVAAAIGLALVCGLLIAAEMQPAMAAPDGAPMMTQTALTVTTITRAGVLEAATAAVTDGHRFSNDGRVFVEIVNGNTDTITATFSLGVTVDGLAVAGRSVAVAAGATKFVGPFPPSLYNQLAGTYNGYVFMTWSTPTSVTVAAWRLP